MFLSFWCNCGLLSNEIVNGFRRGFICNIVTLRFVFFCNALGIIPERPAKVIDMRKKVAFITGAGRGIGRAVAEELSRRNYQLALVSRTRDDLENTRNSCDDGLVLPADVADFSAIERAVAQAVAKFGRIDAVVHCAGVAPVKSVAEMSVEQWREVIEVNLSSAFYVCKAVWPIFAGQGGGVIVNVSSAAARDPFAGFAAYGAAKAGLNLFGLSAAREGQAIGVRVHTIAPSAVETGMFRQILSQEQYPTEKTLSPADVARVIAQCVDGDLRYASGEVIYMHKNI